VGPELLGHARVTGLRARPWRGAAELGCTRARRSRRTVREEQRARRRSGQPLHIQASSRDRRKLLRAQLAASRRAAHPPRPASTNAFDNRTPAAPRTGKGLRRHPRLDFLKRLQRRKIEQLQQTRTRRNVCSHSFLCFLQERSNNRPQGQALYSSLDMAKPWPDLHGSSSSSPISTGSIYLELS